MTRPKSPVRLDWVNLAVCSLDYRLKIIGCLSFFKHLHAEAISKINDLFHDRDVSTDERIYFEGDDADYLYLVAMGKVKLVRNAASGREVMLDILHGGEYFGALTAGVAPHLNVVTFNKRKNHPLIYAYPREFGLLFAKIRVDWRTKYKPRLSVVLPRRARPHGNRHHPIVAMNLLGKGCNLMNTSLSFLFRLLHQWTW